MRMEKRCLLKTRLCSNFGHTLSSLLHPINGNDMSVSPNTKSRPRNTRKLASRTIRQFPSTYPTSRVRQLGMIPRVASYRRGEHPPTTKKVITCPKKSGKENDGGERKNERGRKRNGKK